MAVVLALAVLLLACSAVSVLAWVDAAGHVGRHGGRWCRCASTQPRSTRGIGR